MMTESAPILEQLLRTAQQVVETDPDLRRIQDVYRGLGMDETGSLLATLGRSRQRVVGSEEVCRG